MYPQSELLCPSWNVSVVDESQTPVAGIKVRRSCSDYSVNMHHRDDAVTGALGQVEFGELRTLATRLQRWIGNAFNLEQGGSFKLRPACICFRFW